MSGSVVVVGIIKIQDEVRMSFVDGRGKKAGLSVWMGMVHGVGNVLDDCTYGAQVVF